ncbi:MAG TPA: MFS transporter [Solirubrobacteraceae bacterium]|nr:MFS transporter [Solirubrobacteraceae bacterium]
MAAYALLAASTQLLWLTYAPLTTASAHHYHVSEDAIGLLAEIFPLFYVVLAVPAGRLLDRSFHRWLATGAVLTAAGGLVRLIGLEFAWALIGQVLVATGQPLVLNAVTKVAGEHLPPRLRPHGIAAGSAAVFVGMLLALVLGTIFGGAHIPALLAVQAAFGVIAAAAMLHELRRHGRAGGEEEAVVAMTAVREVWAERNVRVLCGLLFLGFGVFIALTTWLQALLQNYHVSSTTAGTLLVAMVLAGAVGAAALPPLVVRRRAERRTVGAAVAIAAAGGFVLAFEHSVAVDAVVLIAIGLLLLTLLPVILELSERRAGASAGTVTALLWLAGNAGGLLVAVIVAVLVHHPTPAFLVLAVVSLLAIPLVFALSPDPVAAGAPAST